MDDNDFELKREPPKEYDTFDEYLGDILIAKASNKSFLKSKGSTYEIAESFDREKLKSINIYRFDNGIFQKFRTFHDGKCAQYMIDDACMNFGMDDILKAANESGYAKIAGILDKMSYKVDVFNSAIDMVLDEFVSSGNKRVNLNVQIGTYTRMEKLSTSLLIDKASLQTTCYLYSALCSSEMEKIEWIRKKICKVNEIDNISFTCKHFRPYFNLLEGFKLKKKVLKTVVFTYMSVYYTQYKLYLYKYLMKKSDIEEMHDICEMYKVIRSILVLSARRADVSVREELNEDKKHIDTIKKKLKQLDSKQSN